MAKICLLKYTSNRHSANTRRFWASLFLAMAMCFGMYTLSIVASKTLYAAGECENYNSEHPKWIFCDDFEDSTPLVREGRYFEYGSDDGDFILKDGVGLNETGGMRDHLKPRKDILTI